MIQAAAQSPLENNSAKPDLSRPDYYKLGDIIVQAQAKVSKSIFNDLSTLSGLSKKEIASLIGLTERSLDKSANSKLSVLTSEHVLLLKSLFAHGLTFFDQNQKALTKWLKTPLPELACPETGFFPVWPTSPPPPLNVMTAFEPFNLTAYAARRDQSFVTVHEDEGDKIPYPTPLSLLNTNTGIQLVEAVLCRVEAGVFS